MNYYQSVTANSGIGPRTVIRTRYRTLEPTFSGSVAGYSTRTSTIEEKTTFTRSTSTSTSSSSTRRSTSTTSSSSTPSETLSSTVAPETTSLVATTPAPDVTNAAGTRAPTASETSTSDTSGGMSAGAKAGIAVGVIAGVLAIAGLIFFLIAKKRRQKEGMQSLDNEKYDGGLAPGGHAPAPAQAAAASAASAGSSPGAPGAAPAAAGAFRNAPPPSAGGGSPWERPMTGSSQNTANPFGSHAELPSSRPTTPSSAGHTAVAAAVAGGIGAAAGVGAARGLQRKASRNHETKQLDLTRAAPGPGPHAAVPPSPASTEYSMSSVPTGQQAPVTAGAAAIAAAGGPPGSAVHRVQLDFEPSLEDELGLKAGQLVRLLHEYDDGWVSSDLDARLMTSWHILTRVGALHPA